MPQPLPSKILVVDDEPKALLLLRNLLAPEGYVVLTASSGQEALAVAAREVPDVVLLDVMMPEMDGYAVCRRLRSDSALAHLPILMLTALDDRESTLRGIECGADDFLTKPFDSTELRARLRTITRLNRFRQLYEERARLEAAIAHAPDGVILAHPDGTILQRNPAFLRLIDPPHAELSDFFAYLPIESVNRLRSDVDGNPQSHPPFETVLNFAARPGTIVEIASTLVPWQGRGILHLTVRDLTDRKHLEQQLLHSQRIELLGQLAGSAIHDVNNILSAIGGSAQLLQLKAGADLGLHTNQIISSTQRGASVLRQLLMFARGEDGELQSANPAGVAAEVANMIRETFGRHYSVNFLAADNLPRVRLDPTQVHQIVLNLCINARDAMPDGGTLSISVERRAVDSRQAAVLGDRPVPGDYVAISVRDNGTGIPPEVLPKLFDPFFTTKPKGQGTGLGLATVIRLVRRHSGFVTLETEVGRGACFTCYFPVDTGAAH